MFGIILLVLPLISTVNITNTTLRATTANYTIYINNTITLDNATITATSIELYNLSTGGLFTNTNATYPSTVSFYGLNNSPTYDDLRWDNLTIVRYLTDINITAPATRYYSIEDYAGPVTTIIYPDGSDVISMSMALWIVTDEVSSCNYSFDTSSNISMTTTDNLTFYDVVTYPGDGYHTVYYYCFDNSAANNLNVTNQSFLAREWVGGGSAAASGYIVVDKINITLDNIYIIVDKMWLFTKKYSVNVIPINIDRQIVNITNISITIIDDISFKESDIRLLTDGSYKKDFIVAEQNITNLTILVEVAQYDKTITKTLPILMREMTCFDKLKNKIVIFSKSFLNFLKEFFDVSKVKGRIYLVIFCAFMLIVISLLILMIVKKKRKQQKRI